MEINKKVMSGFIVVLLSLSGVTLNQLSQEDTQLFYCPSKDLMSDCVNGVKADGLRCYYNETNARSYSYCAEGWQAYTLLDVKEKSALNQGVSGANKYVCSPEGCVAK